GRVRSSERHAKNTRAPRRVRSTAVTRPMPVLAPVINATRPSSIKAAANLRRHCISVVSESGAPPSQRSRTIRLSYWKVMQAAIRTVDGVRLAVLAAIWGASFIFIRVVAPVLGPVWTTEGRVLIGGLALAAWFAFTGFDAHWRRHWRF